MRKAFLVSLLAAFGCNSLGSSEEERVVGTTTESASGSYGNLPGDDGDDHHNTTEDTATETEDDTASDGDCTETTWYIDVDGDGYGDANHGQMACDQPAGYVADNGDLNDDDPDVGNVTQICAVDSNGYGFSVAVENLTTGDRTHWFDTNGTVPFPLYVVFGDDITDPVCAEYPEAGVGNVIQLSGLGTTTYGYGDYIVYACGGFDGDAVFYDDDTTCSVVEFTVNGYAVTETAANTYDFAFTI
ncbi:MAG: hypothetical protein WCT28_03835 [Patescibacteria group bacterium]|jgi:hypothetical protein